VAQEGMVRVPSDLANKDAAESAVLQHQLREAETR
jgi:hypothetical protein